MGKVYAVMLFETEIEHNGVGEPNKWVNTSNAYFENGSKALEYYTNTPCPASQLIDATDKEELRAKMGQMILNYMDSDWLDKNLYPYL
jgi:hypothetical protein